METGNIIPGVSMVEAGSQAQLKLQDAPPTAASDNALRASGPETIRLANTRLVIETDRDNGGWVYKTVDVNNGQILAQYPLRSVWEIILSRRSGLGLVVDAKA
jgi:hypothetical protein